MVHWTGGPGWAGLIAIDQVVGVVEWNDAWRLYIAILTLADGDLGLFLALLLILDLSLLVEDLFGLSVTDKQHHGGEDQDDASPGSSVSKSKFIGASAS